LHPERHFLLPFHFEVFECVDVVNLNVPYCTTDLARIRQQSLDKFASGRRFAFGWEVLYLSFQVTLEWYSSKSDNQWFLAFPFDSDFKTFPWALWESHCFLVLGTHPGNTGLVLVRERFQQ
jgi:hypothetical protein